MVDSNKADHCLDAKGLSCPLPILKAKKALNAMAAGETLIVEATDAGSVADFVAFCRMTGNTLLESSEVDGVYVDRKSPDSCRRRGLQGCAEQMPDHSQNGRPRRR